MVCAHGLQAEGCGFEPRLGREKFQIISSPSSFTHDVLRVEYKVDSQVLSGRQWY